MKLFNNFFLYFAVVFFLGPITACAGDTNPRIKKPVIYDLLTFKNKPDLGLSTEMTMIYEWEATIRDEAVKLRQMNSDMKPTAKTIEEVPFINVVQDHSRYKYIVIDIESLHINEDPIAIRYVELSKAAATNSKVAKWNTGPRYVVKSPTRPFDKKKWQAEFDKRKELVDANDFCILGLYFRSDDTIVAWQERHVPRIAEARRLYGSKPIFVTLAPHYFDKGKPWPFVSDKLLGEAMDIIADQEVDGIVLWSFEGARQIQTWEPGWQWIRAVRARTDPMGMYKKPVDK